MERASHAEVDPAVEGALRREREEGRSGGAGLEVTGHVEHDAGRCPGRRDVRRAERPAGAQGHGHAVGPVVALREVERRCRSAGRRGQDDVAGLGLPSDGQVAGHRDRIGRDRRPVGDREGPRRVGKERAAQAEVGPVVEHPCRRDRVEPGAAGAGREVAGHVEHDLGGRARPSPCTRR